MLARCFKVLLALSALGCVWCAWSLDVQAAGSRRQYPQKRIQSFHTAAHFIENRGQIIDQDERVQRDVRYIAPQPGLNVILKDNSFSYESYRDTERRDIRDSDPRAAYQSGTSRPCYVKRQLHRIDVSFVGAQPHPQIEARGASTSFRNYYTPGCPNDGIRGVRDFESVVYRDVYPNIDCEFFRDSNGAVEYQFIVRPGGDVSQIRLRYDGALTSSLRGGVVQLAVRGGVIREHIPLCYTAENKGAVQTRYVQLRPNEFGFVAANYNAAHTLVIDPSPSILWGTYYGDDGQDAGLCVCVDKSLNIYMGGFTTSTANVVSSGAYQTTLGSTSYADILLVKMTKDDQRVWATYYGGNNYEEARRVVCDNGGNLYVCGKTESGNVMASTGAHQTSPGGAFLAKFNPDGTRAWGTYYGAVADVSLSVCLDAQSNIVMSGTTTSAGTNIATSGAYQTSLGSTNSSDAYVVKFNPAGTRLWGTYYGAGGQELGSAVTVDLNNNVLLCGLTSSPTGLSTAGAHQTAHAGTFPFDAFIVRLSADGTTRLWATYYGSNQNDWANDITVDAANNVIVCGQSHGATGIFSTGAFQTTNNGGLFDAFIVKFNSAGVRQWGTLFGGTDHDHANTVVVNRGSEILIAGRTTSNDVIASADAHQPTRGGMNDGYLAKFSSDGRRVWSTYYGGAFDDEAWGIANDTSSSVIIAGQTKSADNISTPGAYRQSITGSNPLDGFMARFSDCTFPAPVIRTDLSAAVCLKEYARYMIDGATGDVYQWSQPRIGTIVTATNGTQIMIQWTTVGRDTVRVRQTTQATGCFKDTMFIVNVYNTPAVNAGSNASICKGDSVLLTGSASSQNGSMSYRWSPATGLSAADTLTPMASPRITTTYTLSVSDLRGCVSTASVTVTVSDPPVANAGAAKVCCVGGSVQIGTPSQTNCRYRWSPANLLNDPTLAQPMASIKSTTVFQVVVTNTQTGCVDSSFVTVRTHQFHVSLNPNTLEFGNLGPCESNKDMSFQLTNDGPDSISISRYKTTDPSYSVLNLLPFGVGAGKTVKVNMRYNPKTAGVAPSVITFYSLQCDTVATIITAHGYKSSLALSSTPDAVKYGTSYSCSGAVKRDSIVTLRNNSTDTISITSLPVPPPFSIVSPGFPQLLAPDSALSVVVRYAPTSVGVFNDNLLFAFSSRSCRDTVRIAVQGADKKPIIRVPLASLDFTPLLGCEPSRDTTITIRNESDEDVVMNGVVLSTTDVVVVDALPPTVPAKGTMDIHLRFSPATTGSSTTIMTFLTEPCPSFDTILIHGSKQGLMMTMPDTVDLGSMLRCKPDTVRAQFSVRNASGPNLKAVIASAVSSINFSHNAVLNDSISGGQEQLITVRFVPPATLTEGTVLGTLNLVMQPCDIRRTIVLRLHVNDIHESVDHVLNFGSDVPGTVIQRQARIINRGTTDFTIDALSQPTAPFALATSNPNLPYLLKAGDTVRFNVEFTVPNQLGTYSSVVNVVSSEPCTWSESITCSGSCLQLPDSTSATIVVNDLQLHAGQWSSLVVRMINTHGLQLSGAPTTFRATLAWNRSILMPFNGFTRCSDPTTTECELVVNGDRRLRTGDTLAVIPVLGTLGNTDHDVIALKDFTWTDGSIKSTTELKSGSIHIIDGCEEGGVRLYIPGRNGTSLSARPIPVLTELDFEIGLAEPSQVQLELIDAQGRVVASVLNNVSLPAGRHLQHYQIPSTVSDGTYVARMRTQNYQLQTAVVVIR